MRKKPPAKTTRAWAVIDEKKDGPAFWVEVSLLRGNLPELGKGEKLVRVIITK